MVVQQPLNEVLRRCDVGVNDHLRCKLGEKFEGLLQSQVLVGVHRVDGSKMHLTSEFAAERLDDAAKVPY